MRITPHSFSDTLADLLSENGLFFNRPELHVFEFHTASDAGGLHVRLQIEEENGVLRSVVTLPVAVPVAHAPALLAGLNILNAALDFGTWFLTPDHGWIAYRMATPIPGAEELAAEFVLQWIGHTTGILDLAAPRLLAIAFSKCSPASAAADILAAVANDGSATTRFPDVPAGVRPELN